VSTTPENVQIIRVKELLHGINDVMQGHNGLDCLEALGKLLGWGLASYARLKPDHKDELRASVFRLIELAMEDELKRRPEDAALRTRTVQ
jgi:hypothetical protein